MACSRRADPASAPGLSARPSRGQNDPNIPLSSAYWQSRLDRRRLERTSISFRSAGAGQRIRALHVEMQKLAMEDSLYMEVREPLNPPGDRNAQT